MSCLKSALEMAVGAAKVAAMAAVIMPPVTMVLFLCCYRGDIRYY